MIIDIQMQQNYMYAFICFDERLTVPMNATVELENVTRTPTPVNFTASVTNATKRCYMYTHTGELYCKCDECD